MALQNAIEKAREASMPKDNIERAVARGSGPDADSDAYEAVTYEGYGPGGVAVLVEALTDNRNRTAADIRHIFTKNDGNLGSTGAVAWQFERRGFVFVEQDGVDIDELVITAAEAGAEDVSIAENAYSVIVEPDSFLAVRNALEGAGLKTVTTELTMVPNNLIGISDEALARKLLRLMDDLEDNEDIQEAYANFDIPDDLIELVVG